MLLQVGRGCNPGLPTADDKSVDGFGHVFRPPNGSSVHGGHSGIVSKKSWLAFGVTCFFC